MTKKLLFYHKCVFKWLFFWLYYIAYKQSKYSSDKKYLEFTTTKLFPYSLLVLHFFCEMLELSKKTMGSRQNLKYILFLILLKVVSATFLLVCFVCLKASICETRKKIFIPLRKLFSFLRKSNFNFQVFKCHGIIKCLSMKHKPHFTE